MNNTIFADFFQKAGFRVLASQSSDWVEAQKGFLLSIPYHQLINPSVEELEELLASSGAIGVRFPTSVENYGFDSNLQFCRTVGYSLENLKRQARQQVKKAEANFIIKELSPEILMSDELELLKKTCARQHRHDPKENAAYWHKLCIAAQTTPGALVLGALGEKGLASFLFILETPTAAEFIIQCSDSNMLSLGPNNLLTFYATKRYLADRNQPLPICYGLGSLEETPSLDRYKVGMGYVLEPIKQRIYIRKSLLWLLNSFTLGVLNSIAKLGFAENYKLTKSIGVIKRYLSQY
ncbi:MAG: hypothetical protein AB9883_00570 [Acidaminococcaceae bacterium]